ncbi:MAG TPA: TIGR01777 family oxidoreductase [Marmoricola sp.]|nr:TIGR01777 family oxidoreductase [Marmoricola sp.]
MRFVIAGASGFLGQAWARELTDQGHQVVRLVRHDASSPEESRWDPATGTIDQAVVDAADVVANLAGASNLHVAWTEQYRKKFLDSRVGTTRLLAEAVARSSARPSLVAQSGISSYGDHGDEVIDEQTPTDAPTFMGDVVRQWEQATAPAAVAGARVVLMRSVPVLDRRGGAMKVMLVPFRLGLGGTIGNGRQYFPTISLHDWLGAASYLAVNEELSGAFNVTGPDSCTNAEFTKELGRALHRPTVLRVPAPPLKAAFGPMAGEMLASMRVEPQRLLEAGYAFAHNDITDRLAAALH